MFKIISIKSSNFVKERQQRTIRFAQVHRFAHFDEMRLEGTILTGMVRQGCTGTIVTGMPQCMKFYYVYILHNKIKNFLYVGYSEDLKQRVTTHNAGQVTSTKSYTPLELIHYEAYNVMGDAKRREEYFKTTKGKVTLKQMLKEYFIEI